MLQWEGEVVGVSNSVMSWIMQTKTTTANHFLRTACVKDNVGFGGFHQALSFLIVYPLQTLSPPCVHDNGSAAFLKQGRQPKSSQLRVASPSNNPYYYLWRWGRCSGSLCREIMLPAGFRWQVWGRNAGGWKNKVLWEDDGKWHQRD